jgi:hypothetical protein
MAGFYEKVGELGVDMTLNVDKKQQSKVNNLISGVKNKVGGLTSAFSGLGAKLSIAGVIAGITGGIMAMNHKLKDTVDYWDKLQTQADSLKITIEDIQKLKLAADLGDIPSFDAFAKNLMNLRKSMSELQRGEDTSGAGYLKDVGIKGDEDIVTALKAVLTSFKKSDRSLVDDAVRVLFGKVDAENLQFLVGGGLDAMDKMGVEYQKRAKQGKKTLLTSKESSEIGKIDEQMKIHQHFKTVEKAGSLKLDEAMRSYEAVEAVSKSMDNMVKTMSPLIALTAQRVTTLADQLGDFVKKIPVFIGMIENLLKKVGLGGIFKAMWGKDV